MTESEIVCWLLDWFKPRGPIPGKNVEEQLQLDYYNAKLVDSLGVIKLVLEMEEHFGIQFSQEHFQDRRFSTIGGLSELTMELLRTESGNNSYC